jgi:hypothetical protein
MNNLNQMQRRFRNSTASVFFVALVALGAWAQDSTTTTIQHGPVSFDTQVRDAEVVYVEGNDLVLKLENGKIEHLVVPDRDKFIIDGNEVSVRELVPGTKLTQTITTATTPRYVNTVRMIEGKVWHVNAPGSVIVALPDGTTQRYTVPNHAKFVINGQPKTVFELRKGMKLKATIVSDDEHTVIEQSKSAVGQAPPPATPPEVGVLLFFESRPVPVTLAGVEEPASVLPTTGTILPLIGLLGVVAVATSLGLRTLRQTSRG